MTTLAIRALGRPAPQGSHELGSNGHVMHSSNYLAAWRRQVQIATLAAVRGAGYGPGSLPLFGPGVPVYVHELVLLVTDEQCRAAGTDEPTGRPDVDKLLRATIDGLGDAKLFADDAQITKIHELSKARPWAAELPGAIIIISDRPLPVVTQQGESMSSTEYRISLERVTGRDNEGFRQYEDVIAMHGTAGEITGAGLTTIGALLGAGQVTVVDSSAAREAQAELGADAPAEEPKRGRGRPRKQAAPAAEPVAAEPQAPVAVPTAEPVAQAPAQPVGDTEGETQAMRNVEQVPVAPAGRVNPFA